MNFSDYYLKLEGMIVCEPCLVMTLYSETNLNVPDYPDILGPYRAFLAGFKDSVRYSNLDMNQARDDPIEPMHFDSLPKQLALPRKRRLGGIYGEFRNGKELSEVISPYFSLAYYNFPECTVIIALPLKWFGENGVSGVEQLLDESLQGFPLLWGLVGYSFIYTTYGTAYRTTEDYFSQWLLRHHGLMNPSHHLIAKFGLNDLGWITLLCPEYVEKIGGHQILAQKISNIPEAKLRSYSNGSTGIRLGETPRLGDTRGSDLMADYKALGKILSPLRNRKALSKNVYTPGLSGSGYEKYWKLQPKWTNRFFT